MLYKIKKYVEELDPSTLSLDNKIIVSKIEPIGLGESNLNFLIYIKAKKFNLRINMDSSMPDKSKNEYLALRLVEHLGFAPRAYHFESRKHILGGNFIILEYIEGISLDKMEINLEILLKLARIVAQLHSTPLTNILRQLRTHNASYEELLKELEDRITYIIRKRNKFSKDSMFDALLKDSFNQVRQMTLGLKPHRLVIGHGDIAPQNVILHKEHLKFIDWEDLGIIDPALELSIIFDSFDFLKEQQDLFLKEYLKFRNDRILKDRIKIVQPFQLFSTFCWAVKHVFEIKDGEMHETFIKEQNLKEHIDYAKKIFEKCKNEGIVKKNTHWDEVEIFP
ncbi:MAG: aminoglycoside phosphotransferase family protein [Promethearchaeota archaeon]